jgi:hypothetical protein
MARGVPLAVGTALAAVLSAAAAQAAEPLPTQAQAQAAAPIGVYGADMPNKGVFVFSVTPSFIQSQGNLIGTNGASPQYIIANVSSAYTPVGAHLLRMVPASMSVDSQGLGVAYGLTNNVAVTISTAVVEKSVHMETFAGLTGANVLGYSVGKTSGLGDTSVAAIVRVYQDPVNRLNLNFGLSLPTGSVTDTFFLLTPNGTSPEKRAFYGMQPGSGTVDAMPGVAYTGVKNAWSWGVSYRGRIPLGPNGQGWQYGALEDFNGWGGYTWAPGLQTTLRLNSSTQGAIRGNDVQIRSYGQSGDPLLYGGEQMSVFGGVLVSGRYIGVNSAQFGLEAGAPVYQRLNGPQISRAWQLNLALRYKL